MKHAAPRSAFGFTLVELLVVTAIVAILIALLIPSLGQARAVAKSTVDQANQRGILQGALSYAADNKQSIPFSRGFEGVDFTPSLPPAGGGPQWAGIYSVAGNYIWGTYPALASSILWGNNAYTNGPLGYGACILGGYVSSDIFYSPNERLALRTENGIDYPSWWALRKYIGTPYTQPWTQDGLSWGFWDGGSSFQLPCSYAFRMADWQTTPFDDTTKLHTGSTGPSSAAEFANAIHPRNLRTDTAGFNSKVQIMNSSYFVLSPVPGANAGYGDGSVTFWRSELWAQGAYSRGENWNHVTKTASNPYKNNIPGDSWSAWRTLQLNAAERFARP